MKKGTKYTVAVIMLLILSQNALFAIYASSVVGGEDREGFDAAL